MELSNLIYKEDLYNGATGATGATGPTGPTGPSFNEAAMVHEETEPIVETAEPIKFSTTNLANGISYDPTSGEFKLPSNGQYIIHWWVNVRSRSKDLENCEERPLGIELHQVYPFDSLIAHSSTHNRLGCCDTGTINGNAIFNASANSTFRFINSSMVPFQLVPNDLYAASVSITRIN